MAHRQTSPYLNRILEIQMYIMTSIEMILLPLSGILMKELGLIHLTIVEIIIQVLLVTRPI